MSPANEPQLPLHRDINIPLFLQTLGNTATANKFLWTLSFLENLQRSRNSKISFEDISRGMMRHAAVPIYEYKFDFGNIDITKKHFSRIFPGYDGDKAPIVGYKCFSPQTAEQEFQQVRRQLEVYVPYRWLTPFFQEKLRGLDDGEKNTIIKKLAGERFGDKQPPPYRFDENGGEPCIVLSPLWQEYFLTNMDVIRGWVLWHWAKFLQNRNFDIPKLWHEFEDNWDKLAWETYRLEQGKFGGVNVHPEEDKLPEGIEKERVVRQRINQDFFRHAVLSVYDKRCCITGIDIPEVLIASHIKPWAQCEPAEQTNPSNGLCLNTLHDCAFDRGLITVTDDLCVQTSSMLEKSRNDTVREWLVGFNGHRIEKPEKFLPSRDFLAWHRTHVFRE